VVLNSAAGLEADHIDNDGLNNTIENLRPATREQQCQNRGTRITNRAGYKGVDFHKTNGAWRARILVGGKSISRTGFKSAENAAIVYNIMALEHFGEFARLNV